LVTEIVETVVAPVLPTHLVVRAGLSSGFESLDRLFQDEVIRRRGIDLSERIAQLDLELAGERAALSALSALRDFLEPPVVLEPRAALPRKVS